MARGYAASGVSGVYVVFGPDNQVYVGESRSILDRENVKLAHLLSLNWFVVKYMPDATVGERMIAEGKIARAYRRAGSQVVNRVGLPRHPVWTEENKRRASDRTARARATLAALTPDQRREVAQRAWATRRKNARI